MTYKTSKNDDNSSNKSNYVSLLFFYCIKRPVLSKINSMPKEVRKIVKVTRILVVHVS